MGRGSFMSDRRPCSRAARASFEISGPPGYGRPSMRLLYQCFAYASSSVWPIISYLYHSRMSANSVWPPDMRSGKHGQLYILELPVLYQKTKIGGPPCGLLRGAACLSQRRVFCKLNAGPKGGLEPRALGYSNRVDLLIAAWSRACFRIMGRFLFVLAFGQVREDPAVLCMELCLRIKRGGPQESKTKPWAVLIPSPKQCRSRRRRSLWRVCALAQEYNKNPLFQ